MKAAPEAVPDGTRTETIFVGADATTIALLAAREPLAPGVGRVNVALLLAASTMVPPLRPKASDDA